MGAHAPQFLSFLCSDDIFCLKKEIPFRTRLMLKRILGKFPQSIKITEPRTIRETMYFGGKKRNVLKRKVHLFVQEFNLNTKQC